MGSRQVRSEGVASHVARAAGGLLAGRREPPDRAARRERPTGLDGGGVGGTSARPARLRRAALSPRCCRPLDGRAALLGDLAGASDCLDIAVGASRGKLKLTLTLNLSLAPQHLFCSNSLNG